MLNGAKVQKRANLVDLVRSFLTSILKNSLAKFGFDTAKNEPLKGRRKSGKIGIWNLNGIWKCEKGNKSYSNSQKNEFEF